eukprot:scaffold1389_cov251-Ochromonas_danica.AAC.6
MAEEDFVLDRLLWEVGYSIIESDDDDLLPSDEKSVASSQTTSWSSDTTDIITVGREDQQLIEKDETKTRRTPLTTKQLRRLKHRKRCQLTFTRMVKDDLRRVFPTMYCNVRNQGNLTLTKSFLRRYVRSDCEVISYGYPSIGLPLSHLKGPDEFASYLDGVSTRFPDSMLFLIGSQIIRKFHEECTVIEIFANFKATQVIYSYAIAMRDQVNVGPSPMEVVNVEAKYKISIFMNSEGAIVRVVGAITNFIPAFLTVPSNNTV